MNPVFQTNPNRSSASHRFCGVKLSSVKFPRQLGAIFEFEGQVVVAVNRDCFDHRVPQALIELRKQAIPLGEGCDELNQFFTLGPAVKTLIVELS